MSAARSWKPRGKRSCAPDVAARPTARGGLLLLLAVLSTPGCAGLFQRSAPARPAEYARTTVGPIKVGFAATDITPKSSVYLAGFNPARRSTGVHSRLEARAMVMVAGDRTVAIVGLDGLGLQREDAEWIKRGLVGVANGDVFLCSSHTHAGPDPIGIWGWYFLTSGRDPAYIGRLRRQIAAAVAAAKDAARPAKLFVGHARLPREGLVKNSNRRGVFPRRVTVLQARDAEDGSPLGALLHLVCHPEMMRRRNTLISSDLCGELCDQWGAAGYGQAVFVNGELGAMVSPAFHPRGPEGMPQIGARLLGVCERAVANARPLPTRELEIRRRDVYLPLQTAGLTLFRLSGVVKRRLYSGKIRASVGYLRLDDFEAISVPGEMEPVLAEEIRRALHKPNLVVFGLVDDEVGYLMRAQDARDPEFAYERTMSPCAEAGELVRAALVSGLTP